MGNSFLAHEGSLPLPMDGVTLPKQSLDHAHVGSGDLTRRPKYRLRFTADTGRANRTFDESEGHFRHDREKRNEDAASEELSLVSLSKPIDDEPAESSPADESSKSCRGNDRDGRVPQPDDDQRRGERNLDLEEDLSFTEAHPPAGFDFIWIYGLHSNIGIQENGWNRQQEHRDHGGREPNIPGEKVVTQREGEDECEDAERRQGPAEIARGPGEKLQAPGMP